MNGDKTFYSPKSTSGLKTMGGKPRDLPSTSKIDPETLDSSSNSSTNSIPIIRQCDNAQLLPKYSTILGRNLEDGVNMYDLDQLQSDLERLFSTCAVRSRWARAELEAIDRTEEKKDKKGKSQSSLKRKKPLSDDSKTTKCKDPKNIAGGGARPPKKQFLLIDGGSAVRNETPKNNLPKNTTSDRFWATVEPFCADITPAHAAFLDKLIEECSQEIDLNIPELGEYYANEWNESTANSEADLSKSPSSGGDARKNGLNAMVHTLSNPLTQRLLSTLIEERVMPSFPNVTNKLKTTDFDFNVLKSAPRNALCMDRHLIKNLIEQGIINVDDLPKINNNQDDEILEEIKKCKQELMAINEYNVEELKRLKEIVVKDFERQEIKSELEKVDQQILEAFNEIMEAKQRTLQDDPELVENLEKRCDALLKQQTKLQQQLNSIHTIY